MKLPISITEKNGDTSKFGSVQEAEREMEAVDVERGEYVATDGNGQRLKLDIVEEEVSLIWGLFKTRIKKVRIADPGRGTAVPDQ